MLLFSYSYVAREILVALEYLHSRPRPIVHRDVKASNILVRMDCECHNPLVCVCRKQPDIVLSDFDASLELSKDGTLEPDPPRASTLGFQASTTKVSVTSDHFNLANFAQKLFVTIKPVFVSLCKEGWVTSDNKVLFLTEVNCTPGFTFSCTSHMQC